MMKRMMNIGSIMLYSRHGMKLLCMFLWDTLIIQTWSNSCLFYTEKAPKSRGFFVLFNFQPLVILKKLNQQFVSPVILENFIYQIPFPDSFLDQHGSFYLPN